MSYSTQGCVTTRASLSHEQHGAAANEGVSASQTSYSARSIQEYVTAVARGDAPITTLLQQQGTESSLAARQAKVQCEINGAVAKFDQAIKQGR
ncbi:hypothetical protein F4820DRAFT_24364 [Hypoxylon rubiginosum]|uniref:Uncharacterized protein n=1 Tax=Hypoxylon rubiginosum TaxID=110542 RepID=A0ACB9YSX2_9PEZI|nr:hypothetical protein F4820DRAFT_24364 [Hypoxylon rubiginosum]